VNGVIAAELAKCQANNKAVGFTDGYVSGFPESEFAKLENALSPGTEEMTLDMRTEWEIRSIPATVGRCLLCREKMPGQ
jgi:hypothetical protein